MDNWDDWYVNRKRQSTIRVHKDTYFIPLVQGTGDSSDLYKFSDNQQIEKNSTFFEKYSDIADLVYSITPEEQTYRITLILLPQFQGVSPHDDFGKYYDNKYRYHINISGFTRCNEDGIIIQPGELWELNNSVVHSTYNPYPIPRIALVWDSTCQI